MVSVPRNSTWRSCGLRLAGSWRSLHWSWIHGICEICKCLSDYHPSFLIFTSTPPTMVRSYRSCIFVGVWECSVGLLLFLVDLDRIGFFFRCFSLFCFCCFYLFRFVSFGLFYWVAGPRLDFFGIKGPWSTLELKKINFIILIHNIYLDKYTSWI